MKCRLPVLLLMLLVSGCAALPASVLESDATSELAVPAVYSTDTPRQSQAISGLLDVFQYPVLDDLVGHALDENLDIRFAAQQLEEARFTADAQLGDLLPSFSGGLSASRERDDLGETTETYSPTLDVSWEVDLWGQLRASRGSLQAETNAQMETLSALRDSIAAQVMQSWFDVVLADQHEELEQARLENLKSRAAHNARNYQAGIGTLEDLSAMEREFARTRAVRRRSYWAAFCSVC